MLDLIGHMIIWGGLFAHGDGSTVLCYALPTVVQGFGANETVVALAFPDGGGVRLQCVR
jgi:hypothetical protein